MHRKPRATDDSGAAMMNTIIVEDRNNNNKNNEKTTNNNVFKNTVSIDFQFVVLWVCVCMFDVLVFIVRHGIVIDCVERGLI